MARLGVAVYQIAQQSSLAQMATLAEAQGYVPTTGRTYVLRGGPLPADSLEGNTPAAAARRPAADEPASAPAAWLEQTTHWWQGLSQSSATAAAQFWRDITGRVE